MSILRVRDRNGNIQEIPAIMGSSYVLTDEDKQEIAELVIEMLKNGDEVDY